MGLAFEGRVVLPDGLLENGLVVTEGDRITYVGRRGEGLVPCKPVTVNGYLWPGLIDLHVHGAGGADVMEGTVPALRKMACSLVRHGVTGFLATTVTAPMSRLEKAILTVVQADADTEKTGAELLGIHLEGPWISPSYRGAQNPTYILPTAAIDEVERLAALSRGRLKMVTLAPEVPGSKTVINALTQLGIIVSLGHSGATWDEVQQAVEAGTSHITHVFNGMGRLHHREPGVAGAALADDRLTVEVIADGFHVHPAVCKVLARVKPPDHLILVSDGIAAAGLPDGNYRLGGLPILTKDGRAILADGTLAGSLLTLDRAVRNFLQFTNLPMWQVVRMASLAPAKKLGLAHKLGSIEVGKRADLVVVDENCQVSRVYLRGQEVYRTLH